VATEARLGAMVLLLLAAACGVGGDESAAEDSAAAADKARVDSIRAVRKVRDSVERVTFTVCSDSVLAVLQKTAAGRKVLAKPPEGGTPFPEVVAACGSSRVSMAQPTAAIGAAKAVVAATNAATDAKQAPSAAQQTLQAKAEVTAKAATEARQTQRQAMTDSVAMAASESQRTDSIAQAADTRIEREVFAYSGGTRDPFASAVKRKTVGPEVADLQLVGVLEDPRAPTRSVATFRDKRTGKRHSVRQGDQIGRNRVVQIRDKDVVFSMFDFGIERRETLTLRKQEDVTP